MTPFRHRLTNATLAAPDGWDEAADGTCMDLPISQTDGVAFSYWRPGWRERLALLLGGNVRLGVFGRGHPPVSIDTIS